MAIAKGATFREGDDSQHGQASRHVSTNARRDEVARHHQAWHMHSREILIHGDACNLEALRTPTVCGTAEKRLTEAFHRHGQQPLKF